MPAQEEDARQVGRFTEVVDVLLGNPHRAGVSTRRTALERDAVIPRTQPTELSDFQGGWDEAKVIPNWVAWWQSLPEGLHERSPIATGVALLIGAQRKFDPARTVELASNLQDRHRWPCIELSHRQAAVQAAIDRICGSSESMLGVRYEIWRAAFGSRLDLCLGLEDSIRETPVLILGDTGTGKELVAYALRQSMPGRKKGAGWQSASTRAVNLASISEGLVHSALFGHRKGSFTGAVADHKGVFEICHGGVVYLDEIAELPSTTQVDLLRALQEKEVLPVGATEPVKAAPRIIAGTHTRLEALVTQKRFREDLYYRLSAVVIQLPPLRDRRDDIRLIANRELEDREVEVQATVQDGLTDFLKRNPRYSWPGNVRELQMMLRALALGVIPEPRSEPAMANEIPDRLRAGAMTMDEVKEWYARRVAQSISVSEAARRLGVDRGTVRKLVSEVHRGT